MAFVREKTVCETVGDLIDALERYDRNMPLSGGLDETLQVYREEPEPGEITYGGPGRITVEDGDGFDDDRPAV